MGKTEDAFNFYKSVFGGEFAFFQRFIDTPDKDRISANELEKVMHVSLPIGENLLMGTDALESMKHKVTFGNNISLSLEVDDKVQADTIFNALSADGKADMPMADASWGAYFGILTDKFGVKWMVNHTYKK